MLVQERHCSFHGCQPRLADNSIHGKLVVGLTVQHKLLLELSISLNTSNLLRLAPKMDAKGRTS